MNYNDIMVDCETLGVSPDSKLLSISAVAFNPFEANPDFSKYPTLDLIVSLDGQEDRSEDPETIAWWGRRDPEVIEKIFAEEGRTPFDESLQLLTKFVWNKERIWAQGVTLDISLLAHAFLSRGMAVPWFYQIVRDSRTLLDLVEVVQPEVTHDSLQDCFRQVTGVQQAVKKLGVTKFIRTN